MPNWKKIIVSGSDAVLNNVTASGAVISGSLYVSGNILPDSDNVFSLGTTDNRFQLNGGTPVTVTGSGVQNFITRFNAPTSVETSSIFSSNDETRIIHDNDTNVIFTISGSNGELFTVTDDNSGNLLEVNDASGIDVFSVDAAGNVTASGEVSASGFNISNNITASFITGSFTGSALLVSASIGHLETIYETASVIYSSGSTKFGDTSDDTHEITGSLLVTGSINGDGSSLYKNITVTVVNDGGNKYAFNGITAPYLSIQRPSFYRFDLSDSSNSGHPFAFRLPDDTSYTIGVTTVGTAGNAGAYVELDIDFNASSSLKYYCTVHGNGMGNDIQVNDLFDLRASGSFSGSFQGDGTNLTGVASPTGSYTGSFTGSILGDIIGTASIADNATTSSHTAGTASIADLATTASYISTASFADSATTASHVVTASFADSTTTASIADSLSQLATASHALTSVTSSHTAGTASFANNATTASFPERGFIDGTVNNNIITLNRGDGSSIDLETTVSGSVESASIASIATTVRNGGSGSFSGSFEGDGSGLTGITVAESTLIEDTFTSQTSVTSSHGFGTKNINVTVYDDNDEVLLPETIRTLDTNNVGIDFATSTTGRIIITKGGHIVSGSIENAISASFALTASYAENAGGGSGFPFSGSALITGSLIVSASTTSDIIDFTNSTGVSGSFSGSYQGDGSNLTGISIESSTITSQTFSSVTSVTASHNFGSENVVVQVYDSSNNLIVPSNIRVLDSNEVGVDFASTRSGRVTVSKGGHLVSGSIVSSSNLLITENLTVEGTASITHLESVYETASIIYSSGSTKFGDDTSDTHEITGSLEVSGSAKLVASQSVNNNTASGSLSFWQGSQAEYDALGSYDNNTIYFVVV